MRYESAIAFRYVLAALRRRHTRWMSALSILGLAVGVMALLISIALLSGLQGQIKQRLIASSPQILVEPAGSNTVDDADAIVAEAKRLGMRDVRPIVSGIGYAANAEQQRTGRATRIRSHEGKPDEIVVTRDIAASIGLDAGREITIVAPRTRLTPFGPVPVWKKYRIAKLVPQRPDQEAADAWLDLSEAEALFGTGGKPTSIEMYGETERAEDIQAALARKFPGVQVKTWKEINRPLFLALRLEKIVMFATIALVIFVAALNLISSVSMLINEKRPSVGVLRTLGATQRNVLGIFVQVGLLIGLTGTLIGNVIGIGFAWAANRFHLVPLPAEMYFVSYLPFSLDMADVVGVNAIAILLSMLATWYPAREASRVDPIAAIKEE